MSCRRPLQFSIFLLALGLGLCGCLSPTLMPAEPIETRTSPDGQTKQVYDRDGDGRADYGEQLGADGRVAVLHFDGDGDGQLDVQVALERIDRADCRELLVILDSVPYSMVKEMRQQGRFRLFHPPSAIVSPFPVMTDLCLAEFFGVSPCPGVDSRYYDGKKLSNGYLTYFVEGNAPWLKYIDAYVWPFNHGRIYLWPMAGYLYELYVIEQEFLHNDKRATYGYAVGPSALGSTLGRVGHYDLLVAVDRFCQSLMQRTKGRLQITLISDHGHSLLDSKPFSLHKNLRAMGYRDGKSLREPGDVVVPRFGPVTCAGVYTNEPAKVAADVVRMKEVALSMYKDGDEVVVYSKDGLARIARSADRYRYTIEQGDPLIMLPILERLRGEGKVDAQGFASDRDLFTATQDHVYPDPLHRLWRAFDGLLVHTPDVLLSIEDGYCYGSSFFGWFVTMKSAHGSLRDSSTYGFVLTTAGELPSYVRMEDLAAELSALGLQPSTPHE